MNSQYLVIAEGTDTGGVDREGIVLEDDEEGNGTMDMCFDQTNDERRKQVPQEFSEART